MTLFLPEMRAFEPILNRAEAEAIVKQHFSDVCQVMEDLVDYGTWLIPRCLRSSPKTLVDLVVLPILMKQVVGLLDAATVLIKEGCVEQALLQLRAQLEASVYIDWTLRRDSRRRAAAYYIWNVRRALRWARRAKRGTKEANAMANEMRRLEYKTRFHTKEGQKLVTGEIRRLQSYLKKPENRGMNAAFERRKGKRLHDPDWYKVLFPRKTPVSFYRICRQVRRLPEYRVVYELGSETMHSSRWDAHVTVREDGKVGIRSLRELTDMSLITQLLMGQTLHTYTKLLERYRPEEKGDFARKYIKEWRSVFLSRRTVQYQYVEQSIG